MDNGRMPLIRKCAVCSKPFGTKPFFVKRGMGKYCSRACHHIGLRKGKMTPCFLCGKETYKQAKALSKSKSGKLFCSKSCQTKWRNVLFIGPKHANWKEGRHAYRSVLLRHKVPQTCRLCKTRDKRVLAVHHLDQNRKNNGVDNLVWLCHNCHHLVHHHEGERERLMVPIV